MKLYIALLLCTFETFAASKLSVDAAAQRHPISSYIYGVNEYSESGLQTIMRIPLQRFGGDATTRYNWKLDTYNSGSDWYFHNFSFDNPNPSTLPDGSYFDRLHERDLKAGALTIGTIPVVGWTPKSRNGECSYSVAKYGRQKKADPYAPDCGNGYLDDGSANGRAITNNDPHDANVEVDETFYQDWVRHMLNRYGPANQGGVPVWTLDNEPEWWMGVHMDIHPKPATYDEVLTRGTLYAKAIKSVDPTALISGPTPAGWMTYFYSAQDLVSGWAKQPWQYWDNPTDQKAHGGVPFLEWYLGERKRFEQQNGYRLLDILDLHGYVTPDGIAFGAVGNTSLRMTSTRALWDPNYIEPNNTTPILDGQGKPVAIRLIPRMREWVAANYPGTKLAITEYNWGAVEDITGAVAQADVLGIFGRESLDYGAMWGPPKPSDPAALAFAMYLNYDGAGNQFGETSVSAVSDDPDTLSVFAAERSDHALTVVVLNKTASDVSSAVGLANFAAGGPAEVWRFSKANLKAIVRGNDVPVSAGAVAAAFPAYSITLFVIPGQQSVAKPVLLSVANAASYDAAAVAPGEIVTLFGEHLAPVGTGYLAVDSNGLVRNALGGVRVLFDGVAAPLVYTTEGQIGAIVPYTAAMFPTVHVQVENQGHRSDPLTVPVAASVPAIFTNDYSGTGPSAVLNQDYSRNGPDHPAHRGSVVMIYATGEGMTDPPGVDGRPASKLLPKPVSNCSVKIGGVAAVVSYCGAAPDYTAGLIQVNAAIPDSVSGGSVRVQLTIGGATSRTGVTLAVE